MKGASCPYIVDKTDTLEHFQPETLNAYAAEIRGGHEAHEAAFVRGSIRRFVLLGESDIHKHSGMKTIHNYC